MKFAGFTVLFCFLVSPLPLSFNDQIFYDYSNLKYLLLCSKMIILLSKERKIETYGFKN